MLILPFSLISYLNTICEKSTEIKTVAKIITIYVSNISFSKGIFS